MKNNKLFLTLLTVLFFAAARCSAQSPIITTIAGDADGDGGPASNASLKMPRCMTADAHGNLFISDYNNKVRKVSPSGIITSVAGGGFRGDGSPATDALISFPSAVAVDKYGNLFISDNNRYNIRKVSTSGIISTIAGIGLDGYTGDGGPATAARLSYVSSITTDTIGNLYLYDINHWVIRKVSTSGTITTYAGNGSLGSTGDGGPATAASLDPNGNAANIHFGNDGVLYIANNAKVRKIDPSGIISTFAGTGTAGYSGDGGPATSARLSGTLGITRDRVGNVIFTDAGKIRKVNPSGIITTICGTGGYGMAGDGGLATAATIGIIMALTTDTTGNIYLLDANYYKIRKIDTFGYISTIISEHEYNGGPATNASLWQLNAAVTDKYGNVYIADQGHRMVRKVDLSGNISVVSGFDTSALETSHGDGGPATGATFAYITGLALDTTGNLFIGDRARIRKINTSGTISTIAGNGTTGHSGDGGSATAALIYGAWGMRVDRYGNLLFADRSDNTIRKISAAGIISTVAGTGTAGFSGDGGTATAAKLNNPTDVDIDGTGNIFIADGLNNRVRKISTSGIITTIAGSSAGYAGNGGPATAALLNYTRSIAVNNTGGSIYISDFNNNCIRKINSSGIISNFIGSDTVGYYGDGGPASAARLYGAGTISVDTFGSVLICDYYNRRVRRVSSCRPMAASITGPGIVCPGSAITLTDTTTGGTWSSSNTSIATVNPSTGVVTGVSPGTATITYTITNVCGTAAATHIVTVNPLPNAGSITGADSLCSGITAPFTDTASGGTWSSSNTSIAAISSGGLVTGMAAGYATITYSVTNGCGTTTVAHPITVHGFPHLTSATTASVCDSLVFNYIPLSDSVGVSISWARAASIGLSNAGATGGGGISEYLDNTTTSPVNAIYVFTVSKHGCASNQNLIVTVKPTPRTTITGPDTLCIGDNTLLSNTFTAGTGFWSSSNNAVATISGSGSSSYCHGVGAGACNIAFNMTQDGCMGSSTYPITVIPLSLCPTGIATQVKPTTNTLLVSPNPNTGAFTLNLTSPNAELAQIIITNVLGEKVSEFSIMTNRDTEQSLQLPAGIYFVTAVTKNERLVSKMVIGQ